METSLGGFHRGKPLPAVAHVDALRPIRWLRAGWEDFRSNPGPSLAHGILLVAIASVVLFWSSTHIDLTAAAVSGLLLVGPVFAAAFYELSRLRERGVSPASFDASLNGALRNGKALVHLGVILAVLVIVWALLSRLLFARAFGGDLPSISATSWQSIFDWRYAGFVISYVGTGGVLAVVAFVVAAVSAPAIFDRRLDTATAVFTSIKAVGENPLAMGVWAVLIVLGVAVGVGTFLIGLVVILPVLGHATWHAYRDLLA
jgi:uncharacterized membrane protein